MKQYLKYNRRLFCSPTILDLGANAGIEAIRLFKEFGTPDCKVVLVEPMIENILEICKRVTAEGLNNNFFIEHCAIDNTSAYVNFGFHKSDGMFGRMNGSIDQFNWRTWNYTGVRTIKTKTLEEICPEPNIVKIDIERHEYVILPNLVKNPHVQIIFCELHGPCYELNVCKFIDNCLAGTGLEATGYYTCHQSQSGGEDIYTPISPVEHIPCSDYKYVIIERRVPNVS